MVKIRVMLFLRWLLGITFVVKQLEREETRTIRAYQDALAFVPAADVPALEKMIRDEQEHEEALVADIEERRVQYLSFIVLGLADALVEIAGIHAGSLGIYNTTRLAGLAGVIAGAAASVAMASAAYAQAKQGSFRGSAVVSAAFTGVSYFVAALILAAPYFVTSVMIVALVFSLLGGFVLLALSTYYNSVVTGSRFGKDFLEIAAVMVGATVLLYILGTLIRAYLGLSI
jgi:VIT1/CCC1 family predicted Fe2+/Mn2+ transporter